MTHPTDPAHLGRWLRVPRVATYPARYAAAIERPAPKGVTVRCVLLACGIGLTLAVALFFELGV